MIPIAQPYLPKNSLRHAHEAIDSSFISWRGKYVEIIQEKLQELLGVKHVLPVANGTVATHLVSKALSAFSETTDSLISPNNVYVAAINSFLYDEEYEITTIDADLDTWNIDLKQLGKAIDINSHFNQRPSVLIVHNIGNTISVPKLKAQYPDVVFVEDNCEGFLGKYEGKYSGTSSLASSISFFANKNITCGEGGAFITNDTNIYEHIKQIHGQGQSSTKFIHDVLGYNYRMTNVQAAILLGQLEILPEILERKAALFSFYKDHLKDTTGVHFQKIEEGTEHSNWMFGIRVENNPGYDVAEKYFAERGIEIRPMFYPASSHYHLKYNANVNLGDETIAKRLNKECFIIPSFVELSQEEMYYIAANVQGFVRSLEVK